MWKNTFQNKCLIAIIVLSKRCHKAFACTLINSWLIYCFNAVKSFFSFFSFDTDHFPAVALWILFCTKRATRLSSANFCCFVDRQRLIPSYFPREPCRAMWALQTLSAVCRHRRPPVSAAAPPRSLITSRSATLQEERIGAWKTRGRPWPSQWMCTLTPSR